MTPVAIQFNDKDIADLERQAIQSEEPADSFVEFAPSFLSIEDPPQQFIIPEITPAGVLKVNHGDPRTMKSLGTLEELIAASTGTPAYNLERFRPARAYNCLYCSQEDAARRIRPRAKGFLSGRDVNTLPETLAFAVFKGIDLDSAEWQERFYEEVIRYGFELVAIDPIRAFTANADKGPTDVMPIAKFFRRFMVRGITVQLVHHDTKPPNSGADTRRRGHRASGGGWFSVSECPVSFEKLTEGRSVVTCEDFKFSADPQPFTITYKEDTDYGKLWLIGEDSSAEAAQTLAIDEKILHYLSETPGASGNAIVKAIHVRREGVGAALDRLLTIGKVDCTDRGRAKIWTIRRTK